jgi:hypothetical protein
MTTRTVRDWRGIKHQLSRYTSDELTDVLARATDTEEQLRRFVRSVEVELVHRSSGGQPPWP